jgi:hypothetical protein
MRFSGVSRTGVVWPVRVCVIAREGHVLLVCGSVDVLMSRARAIELYATLKDALEI